MFIVDEDTVVPFYPSGRTEDEIIRSVTLDFLSSMPTDDPLPPDMIAAGILNEIKKEFQKENDFIQDKALQYKMPSKLDPVQIGDILLATYNIKNVACAGLDGDPENDLLCIYHDRGPYEGLYKEDMPYIRNLAKELRYTIGKNQFKDLIEHLRDNAERVEICQDSNLIPVYNGIFEFDRKTLMRFSPDYVFLSKCKIDYNPQATNVTIHNVNDGSYWDVESWMQSLSDDNEIVELLWKIVSAMLRPTASWDISFWLYSSLGNNGKGTFCKLLRNLTAGSSMSLPLCEFSKQFALEKIIGKTAIIVDETDTNGILENAGNFKAAVTGDTVFITRKFKTAVDYTFRGLTVFCINGFPRVKDKSNSFYRRICIVPFTKCFTGNERKYIKDDYLGRREVLEYVLYRTLQMDFDTIDAPAACNACLADFKEYNDSVRQFMQEMHDRFVWDLLPFGFLYELYKSWFHKAYPSGHIQGRNHFIDEIMDILGDFPDWFCDDKTKTIRSNNRMNGPEPLILEYEVDEWRNRVYTGHDPDKICTPQLQTMYRGLLRTSTATLYTDDPDETDCEEDE